MLKRVIALAMAFIMISCALSAFAAEQKCFSVSDPSFSDGTGVYDFPGLTIAFSFLSEGDFVQSVLSAITDSSETEIVFEKQGDNLLLTAEGFKNIYQLSQSEMIGEEESEATQKAEYESLSLGDQIRNLYQVLTDALKDGASYPEEEISTITSEAITAKKATLSYDENTIEKLITDIANIVDGYAVTIASLSEQGYVQGELGQLISQMLQEYQLTVDGGMYYSDSMAFIDLTCKNGEETLFPVYLEVITGDAPAAYAVVPIELDDGRVIRVYVTLEAGVDRFEEYMEVGVLSDEDVKFMLLYYFGQEEDTNVRKCEGMFAFADATDMNEVNFSYSTDEETFRNLWITSCITGVQAMINYNGVIEKDEFDKTESGKLTVTTNKGISVSANTSFQKMEAEAEKAIVGDGKKPVVRMSVNIDYTLEQLLADSQKFLATLSENVKQEVQSLSDYLQKYGF